MRPREYKNRELEWKMDVEKNVWEFQKAAHANRLLKQKRGIGWQNKWQPGGKNEATHAHVGLSDLSVAHLPRSCSGSFAGIRNF